MNFWSWVKLLFIAAGFALGGVTYHYVSTRDTLEFSAGLVELYLKHKLSKTFAGARIDMKNVQLSWRRADENFLLYASDVVVHDKRLGVQVEIPEFCLYSKIGILFLWGDFGSSRVEMPKVRVSAFGGDKSTQLSQGMNSVHVVREKLLHLMKLSIPVKIENLVLENPAGESFVVDFLRFSAEKEYDSNVFSLEFASNSSLASIRLAEHYKGVVSLYVKCSDFDTKLFSYLSVLDSRLPLYDNIRVSGVLNVVLDEHDQVEYADVGLHSLEGEIPYSSGGKVKVHNFRAQVGYNDGTLLARGLKLLVDDTDIKLNAVLNTKNGDLDLHIGGDVVDARRVCFYWPEHLSPTLKYWYCSNVVKGTFRNVEMAFHGVISDMLNAASYKASADFESAVLTLTTKLGNMEIVKGNMLLSEGNFLALSDNYNFRGVTAKKGVVRIDKIEDPNTVLKANGKVTDNVYQLYKAVGGDAFLDLKEENVSGKANTKFSVELLHLTKPKVSVVPKIAVHSTITSFRARKTLDNFDVHSAVLDVVFRDDHLDIRSSGQMNGRDMTLTVTGDPGIGRLQYKFRGYISGSNMERFLPKGVHLDGYAKASVDWVSNHNDTGARVHGVVDISDISLKGKYFDTGSHEGTVEFVALVRRQDDIEVRSATVTGKDVDIRLHGRIGKKTDLEVERMKLLQTDTRALFQFNGDDLILQIEGKFLDFSKTKFGAFNGGSSSICGVYSPLNKVRVVVRADGVLMRNDVRVRDMRLRLDCDNRVDLDHMRLKATGYFADNSAVSVEFGPIGLEVTSGNAGDFLRALDILKVVEGGHLSVYTSSKRFSGGSYGLLTIREFNVVHAPILAQILTLSSLKGIGNTLNGSGIHFRKLNVPFRFVEGNDEKGAQIGFSESWMEGTELGISLRGKIELGTKGFDIRGQVVPAYAVNKMIWSTPLVGKLLTGGQSRGIVAVDYAVKGTAEKHDVSVNFLSILTPSLLKRVLKAFDEKMMKRIGGVASVQ